VAKKPELRGTHERSHKKEEVAKMPAQFHSRLPLLVLPILSAVAVLFAVAGGATAQSASGSITGRVIWSPCVRGIPLPMSPDAQAQSGAPAAPEAPPNTMPQPAPGSRPIPITGLPAGAVLVAVQNTAVSTRTDEAGKFSLSGVPAGQYMTVAAGPVANESSAIAERPNVFVNGGESVDVGTLSLGGSSPLGIACRPVPGMGAAPSTDGPPQPSETTPPGDPRNP
jgi:hypothetical protein